VSKYKNEKIFKRSISPAKEDSEHHANLLKGAMQNLDLGLSG
jgi:hypothetical protein